MIKIVCRLTNTLLYYTYLLLIPRLGSSS